MIISVIIPVLNEEETINKTISSLIKIKGDIETEIIVVDGSYNGSTLSVIEDSDVIKIKSLPGRGVQMNTGSDNSTGEILLFLHSDTFLPVGALADIVKTIESGKYGCGAFDLSLDGKEFCFRVIEKFATLRSRITNTPFGDQGIFVKRDLFFKIGGFKEIPIMEDIDLIKRIRKDSVKIKILPKKVVTSSRRWKKEGVLRCTLRNWMILIMYFSGVSPVKIKKFYN